MHRPPIASVADARIFREDRHLMLQQAEVERSLWSIPRGRPVRLLLAQLRNLHAVPTIARCGINKGQDDDELPSALLPRIRK